MEEISYNTSGADSFKIMKGVCGVSWTAHFLLHGVQIVEKSKNGMF